MNALQKQVAEFVKRNSIITKKASDEIISNLTPNMNPKQVSDVVAAAFKKHNVIGLRKELLLDSIVWTAEIQAGVKFTPKQALSYKSWYLENAYAADKKRFSEAIISLDTRAAVITDIRESMSAGKSWKVTAQRLTDKKMVKGAIAKDVETILNRAKSAYSLSDNSDGYEAYKKAVKRVQRRVEGMTDVPAPNRLKAAYQDILDLTNKSSAEQIKSAAKRASFYKDRYNAERIARTEIGRAYGDASISDAIHRDDVVAVKFVLSPDHPLPDICDFHTGADLYGMGEGVYPKTSSPEFPFHPNCLCAIEKVYDVELDGEPSTPKDFNPKAGQKFLKSQSKSVRESLLGKGGAEKFADNPKEWREILPMYGKGSIPKKSTVPEKQLYGGK